MAFTSTCGLCARWTLYTEETDNLTCHNWANLQIYSSTLVLVNFCTVNKTAARCSRPMHNHKPRAGCMIAYIAFTSSQPATSSLLNYIQTATSGCDSACILTSCQPARRQTAIHDCQRARSATYSLPPSLPSWRQTRRPRELHDTERLPSAYGAL